MHMHTAATCDACVSIQAVSDSVVNKECEQRIIPRSIPPLPVQRVYVPHAVCELDIGHYIQCRHCSYALCWYAVVIFRSALHNFHLACCDCFYPMCACELDHFVLPEVYLFCLC